MQIMLRTHSELGYKQEQRFHLELGLLKLVHAQRLLPLEQLLSDTVPATGGLAGPGRAEPPRPGSSLSSRDMARNAAALPNASPRPSPFESDRSRKNFGSAADTSPSPKAVSAPVAVAEESEPAPVPAPPASSSPEGVKAAVLDALDKAGVRLQVYSVEVHGSEVVLQLGVVQSLLSSALKPDAHRAVTQAASQAAGRPLKLKLAPKPANAAGNGDIAPRPSGPGTKSRAADDPVVKRMQEKFGAQIRTVIDYR